MHCIYLIPILLAHTQASEQMVPDDFESTMSYSISLSMYETREAHNLECLEFKEIVMPNSSEIL